MIIKINIKNKIPTVDGEQVIICSNNDYRIQFAFDAEWDTEALKTARFFWRRNGKLVYKDLQFSGDTVEVPVLSGIHDLWVGVYTNDLRTTTSARLACEYSVLCQTHSAAPDPGQPVNPGGDMDPSKYYTKEELDPVIEDADRRFTELEEIAEQALKDFEEIVPPLVERVDFLEEGMRQIAEDATKAIADFEARISALEAMPIYEGEVEDV